MKVIQGWRRETGNRGIEWGLNEQEQDRQSIGGETGGGSGRQKN